jgi:hypothetical protein
MNIVDNFWAIYLGGLVITLAVFQVFAFYLLSLLPPLLLPLASSLASIPIVSNPKYLFYILYFIFYRI